MPESLICAERDLFSWPVYWAECFGVAPFLPMSIEEMTTLGWDSCDIIIVTGDAYVDHPSFGMAIVGRFLEAQGYRVGIIAQPDWHNKNDFMKLGKPNLFFAVTAGNMDSMINRYTADRKLRHDDAYTPNNEGGKRPDRASIVYAQRCREAYQNSTIILGGIEASLRRIAHYDYWSDTVRRSILIDAKADMLIYGNGERPLVEVAYRLANGESIDQIANVRNTVVVCKQPMPGWSGIDSRDVDKPGKIPPDTNPYDPASYCSTNLAQLSLPDTPPGITKPWEKQYILLPSYEQVKRDKVLYAHASRILHHETNPGCARSLLQKHGDRYIWVNPPAIPLTTEEMDSVYALPFQRRPHPAYGSAKMAAYEMIKCSISIMRGCFGGCAFCSITEHEGRIIQSRSPESILQEMGEIRDKVPGFTGVISDLGGPTANMYGLRCQSPKAEQTCRRASCVYPDICPHMDTNHQPTIDLYQQARKVPGVKKIVIASGVRYDLAIKDPRYVKELVTYHVGGYLKIAPEHTETEPLAKMMKPGMATYTQFKALFDSYSQQAGKEQYLIPYFIAGHPGTRDEDMVNLALWLKKHRFRLDQVQNFYPSPLSNSTTMYYTEKNPLVRVDYQSEPVYVPKGERQRRLHKALLRYHDPANWPLIRQALLNMQLGHLIGYRRDCLVPPANKNERGVSHRPHFQIALTKHTENQYKNNKKKTVSQQIVKRGNKK